MNDETAPTPAAADTTDPSAAGAPADASAAEAVAKEVTELKDRVLRTLAEMENLRRRTEREVSDARVYGITAFARDLLGVSDNMRRALDTTAPEVRHSADAGIKALVDGIELTERELQKVLEKHGIKKIEPQGQKFDPNFHQAMFELPNPDVPSGTVMQVVQAGYVIADRVLRPALVGVAKGGPKPTAQAPANDNPGETAPSAEDRPN